MFVNKILILQFTIYLLTMCCTNFYCAVEHNVIILNVIIHLWLHWVPLNGIMDNRIIWFMEPNWPRLNKSQRSLNSILWVRNVFGYCYYLVNWISYCLAQSDPIKRRPLYQITKAPFAEHYLGYYETSGYCYLSVDAIIFSWFQSDHIKWLPL
jgi:hypothetical protein